MKKTEVTQLLEALKIQREFLMKAVRRLQGAKQRTKELLDNNINDWEALLLNEHNKCVEFNRERMDLITLIILAEEADTKDAPANEGKNCHS